MKGKDLHPRLLYPAKLSFRIEGQIKCFLDKVKLKEFDCNSIINKIYLGVVVNKCEFAVILTVHSFYLLFLR